MYADSNSMILEVNSPLSLHHYWPLCVQMVALSSSKVLVYSDADTEVWTETLDRVLAMDSCIATTRLKWKTSRNGGRPVACPSATTSALTASRKKPHKFKSACDFVTDLAIKGEVGREDGEVSNKIMAHACAVTGCSIKEAVTGSTPKLGEYVHLASQDPMARPGRLRVFLSSEDEVRKLYVSLHGQTVQVGQDLVAMEISSDIINIQSLAGNAQRRR